MGTGYTVQGNTEGVISQVMETIFNRVEMLKQEADFQLRVSFIEVISFLALQIDSFFDTALEALHILWPQTPCLLLQS
jgi:hypothetical protein